MGDDNARWLSLRDVLRIDVSKLHTAMSEGVNASPAVHAILRILQEPRNRYTMRVLYCPPLPLLWSFRPGDGTAASVVHRAYAREFWHERGFTDRVGFLARLLTWPLIVTGTMLWLTALNGSAIRRRSGKGITRQMYEQLQLATRHAILPPWYYMFELFDDARFQHAGRYLRRDETKGGIYRLLRIPCKRRILNNKAKFADCCRRHDIRTPDHFVAKSGSVYRTDGQETDSLPRTDLFAKPARGRGGRGVESWRYDGSGWSRDGAAPIDEKALLEHFGTLSMGERYLIQRRLVPHPELADLSADVLTTVRIMTILDEIGGYEATHAVYRMPNHPGAKVDNFHAGGLAAKVDIETGELGPASDIGLHPNSDWHAKHPLSGAQISGRKLPFWEETLDLARRAHAAMPERAMIGWDIAIVVDGPVMIEGNGGADLDIIQRTHRKPMGDSRFGELLAHHLETLERGAWPTNSG